MYYLEAENMDTKTKSAVYAPSREVMHDTLLEKGFHCMVKYECYAGINDEGEEISVVNCLGTPVERLNSVNND